MICLREKSAEYEIAGRIIGKLLRRIN